MTGLQTTLHQVGGNQSELTQGLWHWKWKHNLLICHKGVLVSRNCTCTLCKTEQEQNKLEKQDLKQEQKKNSSWQRTAHWMYKDSTIVWELTCHCCGLGSIIRPTQCKRNLKIVLNFVISSPPCYRFLFFSPQFFGFVHWLFKQTLQLQIWVGNTGQRATPWKC